MRKGTWLGIILLVLVFVGIALIDAGVRRPIDWTKTYLFKEKSPFGTYVFRQEIDDILGDDRRYSNFGGSIYSLFEDYDSTKAEQQAIIDIREYQGMGELDVESLLDFVGIGGEVFLSGEFVPGKLLDTLGLECEQLDYSTFVPRPQTVSYTLVGDTTKLSLDKVSESFPVFSKLNPKNTSILGYLNCRGRAIPNFVKVKLGKGQIFLHTIPALFGNYYMLKEDSYRMVCKTINVIKSKDILLSDIGYEYEQPRTPLRVILQKPGFAHAWYLLLVGLFLWMIFKSRREQRAIPIILPEPNKSKEFAQTIGNLYYENGTPGNIIQKKIEYFLFDIRNNYQLDTLKLDDEKFVKQLASKSTVGIEETENLLRMIKHFQGKTNSTIQEVKLVNKKIEDFKQKANLI